MNLARHVSDLRQQLAIVADAAGEEATAIGERLASALEPAVKLMLLDTLSAAAGEITRELAPGSVDVRLRGEDIAFVVTAPPPSTPQPSPQTAVMAAPSTAGEADEGGATRTTLRLPDQLKQRVDEAAAREGLSVNAWLIRTIAGALSPRDRTSTRTDPGGIGGSFTGWVR